jgi:outer membrane protein assembly factor BamB
MNCNSAARRLVLGTFWTVFLGLGATGEAAPQPETVNAAHWAYWRGPSGQGYGGEKAVPLEWSETKNVLWKTELPGAGNSTPIIWGDRIFLTAAGQKGKEGYVLCIRRSDGKLLWKRVAFKGVTPGQTHQWNGYASASCATDGKRVYAFFGTPGLFCYDIAGKPVWKHSFGVMNSVWGTSASPFLYEDLVIQNCDHDGGRGASARDPSQKMAPMALVALDKKTGKVRWQTPRNQGRGFSTPRLIATPQGRLDLVLNSPLGVWAYNPRTGKEIWSCKRFGREGKFGEPIPVSDRDTLYALSGRPGPFQAIRLGGTGDVTKTQVRWQIRRRGRDVSSQILWEGLLYGVDRMGVLTCYDSKDGKLLYSERITANGKSLASPVVVHGKIFFVMDNGETVIIEPGRKLKIAGRNKLGDGSQLDFGASPAVAEGQLFLRSQAHLYCIGEKK